MSFREDVMHHLDDALDAKSVADQLRQVIKGETVTEEYAVDKDGNQFLVKRRVTRKARDVAAGLVIADHLNGGQLGLAPKQVETNAASRELYRQYAPQLDERVVYVPDEDE